MITDRPAFLLCVGFAPAVGIAMGTRCGCRVAPPLSLVRQGGHARMTAMQAVRGGVFSAGCKSHARVVLGVKAFSTSPGSHQHEERDLGYPSHSRRGARSESARREQRLKVPIVKVALACHVSVLSPNGDPERGTMGTSRRAAVPDPCCQDPVDWLDWLETGRALCGSRLA